MTDQIWLPFRDAWLEGETVNGYRLSPEAIQQLRAQLPGMPVFEFQETLPAAERRQLGVIEAAGEQLLIRLEEGVDADSLSKLRPSLDIQAIHDSTVIEQAELRSIFAVEKEPGYNGGFDRSETYW